MSSTWGDKLGRGKNAQLGVGVQVDPNQVPKIVPFNFSNFRDGLMLADRPGDVPAGYYSKATDVETSRRDGVLKGPGVTLIEDTGHSLEWMGIHVSLDFQSALIAVDAPYVGVKEEGMFSWSDTRGVTTHTVSNFNKGPTGTHANFILYHNVVQTVNGLTARWPNYALGYGVGWQGILGTGGDAVIPQEVFFDKPVSKVTVNFQDLTYFGNFLAGYDAEGNEIARCTIDLAWFNVHGITAVIDVGSDLIVRIVLSSQNSGDWITFDGLVVEYDAHEFPGLDLSRDAWVFSNYGDVLLFSNGRESWQRLFDNGAISKVEGMPGALTLFTAFGRLFAGGVIHGGDINILGIMWNGVEGDHTDWNTAAAGSELLLIDVPEGDKIVAGRILSFDMVVVLCRRTIWNGTRTGVLNRPADFKYQLIGVGCVYEPTALTTEAGVTFLSDEGVRHYDGNEAPIISGAINAELLPIDFDNLAGYKAGWNASRRRYMLCTPIGTYIYQFPTSEYPKGAWFKRSIIATNVIPFAKQFADLSWDDMGDIVWEEVTGIWADLATPESNAAPDILFASGTKYGKEDYTASANFGTALVPVFRPRPAEGPMLDNPRQVMIVQGFSIEFFGTGTIQIWAPDEKNVMTMMLQVDLVDTEGDQYADALYSQLMTYIEVKIISGSPEIRRIRQMVEENGPVTLTIEAPV